MKWILKSFNELSLSEFHDIIQLRLDIFVVEQDCPYMDLDGKDKIAYHFFGSTEEGKIIAYTRLFGPGEYYKEAAIGRVVVHKDHRKYGIGFELMKRSIEQIESLYRTRTIKIGAQRYLRKFYESLGFKSTDEFYMEDGIPHMYMIKS
ncbi:GNAT family N-acetyltransferase [Lutimonas saemankumensis]|uniref:GNAT family N-acetyltransferase n=1 Tax=Lutimonas saemankumensis TaxID=483016 RepID=UPI001CD4BC9C|nr:GNAT family N-acetyltransferase [Lutimonas saemankumensis]MCA0932968.1 GNAT family N-acetyltransferase [Lutimonas saemankumensis]